MMFKILLLAIFIVLAEGTERITDCQEHRERESKTKASLPMRLIPECDENGDYKPRQCFQDSNFCACWDKKGNPVTQPSRKIKKCDCLVQKHEVEQKGLRGAFKPACSEDGRYQKQQCHGSTGFCWCAHPETGEKISKEARGKQNC